MDDAMRWARALASSATGPAKRSSIVAAKSSSHRS
jgi:hypothetical protein